MDHSLHAASIFNKYADGYQAKFMDVSLYHHSFDVFCNQIKPQNAQVLELACGPGNITQYLLKKKSDLKIHGTDLAPNMLELAKLNNPNAVFSILDGRHIKSLNKKYDALMIGFCLPYINKTEAIQLIHDASDILNDNGVIYISTMEDDYTKSSIKKGSQGDEIFMHFHEANYLIEALLASKFKIVLEERVKSAGPDGLKVVDLILIAVK